jgi:glycosyltransferase involved in cell wall biosynthesis
MLTIITPCFNAEDFIEACILNVVQQGFPKIEHLIMDGGSQDRTVQIATALAMEYKHLRVYSESDRGQSHAMNKGIRLAKYQTISFLNADDKYAPGTLKYMAEIIHELPRLYFIVGNCQLCTPDGVDCGLNKPAKVNYNNLLLFSRRFPYPANPSAYFYDKELHSRVGYYAEDLHYTMDLEFILRMSKVATIQYINKTLGYFVLHGSSKTNNRIREGRIERERWARENISALKLSDRVHYLCAKLTCLFVDSIWTINYILAKGVCKLRRSMMHFFRH